jgi:hypothetical protein
VTTSKNRVLQLQLLVRELTAIDDAELASTVASLPEESQAFLHRVSRSAQDGPLNVPSLRGNAISGKLRGTLEQVVAVVSDACLSDCIEALGESADLPSQEDLERVIPALVERHGRNVTRLMLASAVAGEAPAGPTIQKLLKSSPLLSAG